MFFRSKKGATPAPPDPLPPASDVDDERIGLLTPQQREVLRHLAQYKTSKEIARLLGLSPRTVENHRFNITTTLDLQGPNRLLRFAVRHQHLL